VLGLLGVGLVIPSNAWAAARSQILVHGGVLSVRSGDGCRLKPVKLATARTARRDFTCTIKGSTVRPAYGAGPARIQTLFNGDTVSVFSGDGCKLKLVKTPIVVRFRRDMNCLIKGKQAVPKPPPPAPPVSPTVAQPPSTVTGGATWRSIYADEFSGAAVDATKWNVQNNTNFGSGNGEDHCYRSANVTVTGGTLRLTARRQTVTGCGSNPGGGSSYYFTSGMVTTRGQGGPMRMKFRHGYAEVQMRAPRGNLYWSAFWLADPVDGSSPGWPAYGEVDVSEIYGPRPDISESNYHRTGGNIGARDHNVNSPPSSAAGANINPPNAFVTGGTNGWHRYGINWTGTKLEWFVDGVLVRTHNATTSGDLAGLSYEKSIILNLALGGVGPQGHGYTGREQGGTYNNGNLVADMPGVFEVDYVRVWQP
jgi:hypothetical protein